jgi:hypothetical protein
VRPKAPASRILFAVGARTNAAPGALAETPPREDRLRLTSMAGCAASVALVVGFFLPWARVPPDLAMHTLARAERRLDGSTRPGPRDPEDWRRLWENVALQGHVAGPDVFHWARIAAPRDPGLLGAGRWEGDESEAVAGRAIRLAAIGVAAVPLAALLLVLHFLAHRLRRARAPALILAMLAGTAAVLVASAHDVVKGALPEGLAPAPGLGVWLVGGAALVLAGAFGVRLRNWWTVYGGTLAVGAALALSAWGYLRWGVTP